MYRPSMLLETVRVNIYALQYRCVVPARELFRVRIIRFRYKDLDRGLNLIVVFKLIVSDDGNPQVTHETTDLLSCYSSPEVDERLVLVRYQS